jgi:hypothetical protein
MCVILICDRDSRPTEEMVRQCWLRNSDGGGVAYHTKVDGLPVVKWEKNLSEEEMVQKCATLPLPFIAHFRITSVGSTCGDLTHPFPLDDTQHLAWEGETDRGVLFHNGTWSSWKTLLMDATFRSGLGRKLPPGTWSDTRAMAYLAEHFGWGILEMIDEKIVVMAPPVDANDDGIYIFGSWPKRIPGPVKEGGGILASNDSWKPWMFQQGQTGSGPGRMVAGYHTTPPASMAGGSVKEIGPPEAKKESATATVPLAQPGSASSVSAPSTPTGSSLLKLVTQPLRRGEEKRRRREARRVTQLSQLEELHLTPTTPVH